MNSEFRARCSKPVLSLLSVVFCVVAAELYLRHADIPRAQYSGWKSLARVISPLELNQLGFRGQPIKYASNDFVIVLVGDSQVFATACSYYRMPEARLELYLASSKRVPTVRVFTVGDSGYGQDQQLAALQEYFSSFRADLVLVWLTPANDLFDNLFPASNFPRGGIYKPTYRLEGDVLVGPFFPMGEKVSHRFRLLQLVQNAAGIDQESAWERTLPPAYVPTTSHVENAVMDWQTDPHHENLAWEKTRFAVSLTPRSERMSYAVRLTNHLLKRMRGLAASNGASFVVFHTSTTNAPTAEVVHLRDGCYYKTSQSQYETNVRDMLDGLDVVTVEITEYPSATGPTDGHLCETAVDQVMRDLSATLSPRIRHNEQAGRCLWK